jgi:hypothetical protein
MKSVAYDGGYRQYREAHGRSGGKPDLQLTGKMLAAFQIVKTTPKLVRLGFVTKAAQAKAIGNITGIRGRSKTKRNARQFLGIGPKHQVGIEAEFEARVKEVVGDREQVTIRRIK